VQTSYNVVDACLEIVTWVSNTRLASGVTVQEHDQNTRPAKLNLFGVLAASRGAHRPEFGTTVYLAHLARKQTCIALVYCILPWLVDG